MPYPLLTQYRLRLSADAPRTPQPEWGYYLYAELLRAAPDGFAGAVHANAVTPLSQYLFAGENGLCWNITLLGDESCAALGGVLDEIERFPLHKEQCTLFVTERTRHSIPDVEALLAAGETHGAQHRLEFCTPAAFKSKGVYQVLPTQRLLLQSLVKKWNGCFAGCPIEDTGGAGLEAMAAGLFCTQFSLQSASYRLKGCSIPCFTGGMLLENRLQGFHRTLASALLLFAGYAGIGIKTTLGMGGVRHTGPHRCKQ